MSGSHLGLESGFHGAGGILATADLSRSQAGHCRAARGANLGFRELSKQGARVTQQRKRCILKQQGPPEGSYRSTETLGCIWSYSSTYRCMWGGSPRFELRMRWRNKMLCMAIAASSEQKRYGSLQSASRLLPIGAPNGFLDSLGHVLANASLLRPRRQDGSGLDVANAWRVDVSVHYIRKVTYRGHRAQVNRNRLKLAFDGLTFPATIFTVPGQRQRFKKATPAIRWACHVWHLRFAASCRRKAVVRRCRKPHCMPSEFC